MLLALLALHLPECVASEEADAADYGEDGMGDMDDMGGMDNDDDDDRCASMRFYCVLSRAFGYTGPFVFGTLFCSRPRTKRGTFRRWPL